MNKQELKAELSKYQYFENTDVIDVALANIISTRLKLGKPVWLVIIGASSGGKSQIIDPISMTGQGGKKDYIHRVDDLTENTFLSGMGEEFSLLPKIGKRGIISMSDLTVLFSRNAESRNAILSQFRRVYDGEMNKVSGKSKDSLQWKGNLGVIAGSTPSIYGHFEQVSDMGERFIYYRMKDYSPEKAVEIALNRDLFGKDLDKELCGLYDKYIKSVVKNAAGADFELCDATKKRIGSVSMLAEKLRATSEMDWKEEHMKRLPSVAYPSRVAIQLSVLAKGLAAMKHYEEGHTKLGEEELRIIDWCAYSLANEEKRAVLDVLVKQDYDHKLNTSDIAAVVGLGNSPVKNILQNLASAGVLERSNTSVSGSLSESYYWKIKEKADWEVLRRINDVKASENIESVEELIADTHVTEDEEF